MVNITWNLILIIALIIEHIGTTDQFYVDDLIPGARSEFSLKDYITYLNKNRHIICNFDVTLNLDDHFLNIFNKWIVFFF